MSRKTLKETLGLEEHQLIFAVKQSGLNIKELSEYLGVAYHKLTYNLNKLGLESNGHRVCIFDNYKNPNIKDIATMYRMPMSFMKYAYQAYLTRTGKKQVVTKHPKAKKVGKPISTIDDRELILAVNRLGLSFENYAEYTGKPYNEVVTVAESLGLDETVKQDELVFEEAEKVGLNTIAQEYHLPIGLVVQGYSNYMTGAVVYRKHNLSARCLDIALNELGLDIVDCGKYWGVSYPKLHTLIKENGVTKGDANRFLFDKGIVYDLKDIASKYHVALDLVELAYEKFDTSWYKARVSYLVNELGYNNRTYAEVADILGVSKQAVYVVAHKLGVHLIVNKLRKEQGIANVLKANKEAIQKDYTDRVPLKDIAEKYNTTALVLSKFIKEQGMVKGDRVDVAKVRDLYINQGLPSHKIADILGVPKRAITYTILQNNLHSGLKYFNKNKYCVMSYLGFSDEEIAHELGIPVDRILAVHTRYAEYIKLVYQVLDGYKAGETLAELSKKVGWSKQTVWSYTEAYRNLKDKVVMAKTTQKRTGRQAKNLEIIKFLVLKAMDFEDELVAKNLNLTVKEVVYYTGKYEDRLDEVKDVINALNQGVSVSDIAKNLSESKSWVTKVHDCYNFYNSLATALVH